MVVTIFAALQFAQCLVKQKLKVKNAAFLPFFFFFVSG
jgi:hypothetical protein